MPSSQKVGTGSRRVHSHSNPLSQAGSDDKRARRDNNTGPVRRRPCETKEHEREDEARPRSARRSAGPGYAARRFRLPIKVTPGPSASSSGGRPHSFHTAKGLRGETRTPVRLRGPFRAPPGISAASAPRGSTGESTRFSLLCSVPLFLTLTAPGRGPARGSLSTSERSPPTRPISSKKSPTPAAPAKETAGFENSGPFASLGQEG